MSIKVPPEVAQAYRSATEAEREQLRLKIAAIMRSQLATQRQDAVTQLRNTMDSISQEAQAKGLTPEILESILNDNE